nr:DNA helicase [Tanacetum cinerariifolium]
MIHRSCGFANPTAARMKDGGTYNRNFPKPYCNKTYIDKEGFVHYRRRDTEIQVQRQHVWLDNRYVVPPYNATLCLRYYAHINVEYYGWTMLIKYLFKYISKGTDRVIANVTKSLPNDPSASNTPAIQIDEIKNYVKVRYIGPHEACWRILDFPIHYCNPPVQTLAMHLENMQQLKFQSKDSLQSIVSKPTKKTTLTEWLEYNRRYIDGRKLTYLNFPSEYAWHAADRYWQRRRYLNKPSIGRLTYIDPCAGDLFYQRTLLCHQKGCTSFADIWKIDNKIYPTNKAACQALGLLSSDQEWVTALEEASLFAITLELRKLFVYILIFCKVSDPVQLWNNIWKNLSNDIAHKLSKSLRIPQIQDDEKKFITSILLDLEHMLNSYSKSLQDFGLPMPSEDMLLILQIRLLQNRMLMEETNYDPDQDAKHRNSYLYMDMAEHERHFYGKLSQDEAPMNDLRCFEAPDHSLNDICDRPNTFFGGKSIMLGGVFRQTLPVKKKASKPEILDASITYSKTLGTDEKTLQAPTPKDLQKKSIVCRKIKDADMINAEILALVNHQKYFYLSFDEAVPHGNNGGEAELLYPAEYLNLLNFAGFPPHRLELKVEHYFNFVAYNEVEQRATKTGVPLTDYIGCVYRISDPLRSGDATRTRRVRRVIDIQNLEYCFKAIINDGTATATITCFSSEQAKPGYPNFTLDAILQPVTESLLALPAAETIKSPAVQVLEETSVGNNATTATEDPSESGKLGVESPSQIPKEKAKKARRDLFQDTDTQGKTPRQDA